MKVTLEQLHTWIDEEYAKAEHKPWVDSRGAYAAYKVWRRADKEAKKYRRSNE